MPVLFFVIALTMSVATVSLVARPLITTRSNPSEGYAKLPLLITVVVVLMAMGLYAVIGRPDAVFSYGTPGTRTGTSPAVTTSTEKKKVGSVASLLVGLEKRLQQEPDDAGGWLLLAKSYQRLGRSADASEAYDKAKALGKSDPVLAAALTGQSKVASRDAEIRGRVRISSEAALTLTDADTVFVLAKAINGSPMPLAVLRKSAADLPFDFELNDSMSMVLGSGISSVEEVIVSVKISRTGDALQTEAEYEVNSRPIGTSDSPFLDLEIGIAESAIGN